MRRKTLLIEIASVAILLVGCADGTGVSPNDSGDDTDSSSGDDTDSSSCAHDLLALWRKDENKHWRVCKTCGEKVDAAAHEFDAGVVTKEATPYQAGEKTYTCAVCDYTKTESIPKLAIPTYTVSFLDYDGSFLASVTVEEGETAVYPDSNPTRPDDDDYSYTFAGWDRSLANVQSSFSTYAQYQATSLYLITFQNDDGTTLQQSKWKCGETPVYSGETPSKDGGKRYRYSFSGWSPAITEVTYDATYVATYDAEQLFSLITFDLDGGSSSSYVASKEVYSIDAEDFFFDVTKDGYQFRGWSYNGTKVFDETGAKLADVTLASEMTFKAVYSDTCKLTLLSELTDGETDEEIATLSGAGEYAYNTQVEIAAEPSSPGYSFIGWYEQESDTLVSSSSIYKYMMWSEDVTLIAKFELVGFAFKAMSNNADLGLVLVKQYSSYSYEESIECSVKYTNEVTVAANTLTDVGFLGWYDEGNDLVSTNAVYTFTMPDEDYSLEAKWNQFDITYDLDGGTLDSDNPSTYSKGVSISGLNEPTKEGYDFLGWYLNDQLVENGTVLSCVDAITLKAKWQGKTYQVTLDPNNGSAKKTISVTYGEQYVLDDPEGEYPDYCYFAGWYYGTASIPSGGTWGIAGNLTLTATYASCFSFTLNSDGKSYAVSGFDADHCSTTDIVIPSSYRGLTITCIGANAFYECTSLTSLKMPESIAEIGQSAFRSCRTLTQMSIGTGVNTICEKAFFGCSKLESVVIPNNVETVGEYAFGSCEELSSVAIGNGIESIAADMFANCENLSSIEIPSNITSIGKYAFFACSSLEALVIPDSVTSIGYGSFCACGSLTSVIIGDGCEKIDANAFYDCEMLETLVVGEQVSTIQSDAFHGTSLSTVFYKGSIGSWNKIVGVAGDEILANAVCYYYSETEPADTDYLYWHYDDEGNPVAW